jgi:hypothetical protein
VLAATSRVSSPIRIVPLAFVTGKESADAELHDVGFGGLLGVALPIAGGLDVDVGGVVPGEIDTGLITVTLPDLD